MASVNYKVAGFSPSFKSDLGALVKVTDKGARKPNGIDPIAATRWAYNFDGVDDYGVLASRAVNVDTDNAFEFWSPDFSAVALTILSQNISNTPSSREFQLYANDNATSLIVNWGGILTTLLTAAQGYESNKKYFLSFIGTNYTIAKDTPGNILRTATFARGASREPTAPTIIGARQSGSGTITSFSKGLQYDLKINGVLWQMTTRNSATQVSTPAGNTMTLVNTTSDRWQEIPE